MKGSKNNCNKKEILVWINDLLQVSVTKVEQLGAGSIFCQLFDVVHPNSVPLRKVNWQCRFEFEFVNNFKILQQAFIKQNVTKFIDISKLSKTKVQDNLEFAQWMKGYFDLNCKEKGKGYDAKKRRGGAEVSFPFCTGGYVPKMTMIFGKKEFKKDGFNDDDYQWGNAEGEQQLQQQQQQQHYYQQQQQPDLESEGQKCQMSQMLIASKQLTKENQNYLINGNEQKQKEEEEKQDECDFDSLQMQRINQIKKVKFEDKENCMNLANVLDILKTPIRQLNSIEDKSIQKQMPNPNINTNQCEQINSFSIFKCKQNKQPKLLIQPRTQTDNSLILDHQMQLFSSTCIFQGLSNTEKTKNQSVDFQIDQNLVEYNSNELSNQQIIQQVKQIIVNSSLTDNIKIQQIKQLILLNL